MEKRLRQRDVARAFDMLLLARHVQPGCLPQRGEEPVRDVLDRSESEIDPTRALLHQTARGARCHHKTFGQADSWRAERNNLHVGDLHIALLCHVRRVFHIQKASSLLQSEQHDSVCALHQVERLRHEQQHKQREQQLEHEQQSADVVLEQQQPHGQPEQHDEECADKRLLVGERSGQESAPAVHERRVQESHAAVAHAAAGVRIVHSSAEHTNDAE